MRIKIGSKQMVMLVIAISYLGINCFFNTLPINNLYDIGFFLALTAFIIKSIRGKTKVVYRGCKEIFILSLYLIIVLMYVSYNIIWKGLNIFSTFITAREMLYLFIVIYIVSVKCDSQKCVLLIINLEFISCLFALVSFLIKHEVSPFAFYAGTEIDLGGITLYRNYCPMPLMQTFTCTYLIGGIVRKEYLYNKRRDLTYLGIIILAIGVKLFRTSLAILGIAIILAILISPSRKRSLFDFRRIRGVLIVCISVILVFYVSPSFRNRFVEAASDVINGVIAGNIDANHGTGTYRVWLLQARINYLIRNNQLLFGMGLYPSNDQTPYFLVGSMLPSMGRIYNPDSAYVTILPRYGLIGISVYLFTLLFIGLRLIMRKDKLSISTGIYIICQILGGISSNEALAQYGPLTMGIVIGLALNETNKRYKNENIV